MLSSRSFALFLVTLFFTSTLAPAQTPAKSPDSAATTQPLPAAAHYSFEVASIRPSSHDNFWGFHRIPDGFRSTGLPLSSIILLAYFPLSLSSSDRIQNAPAWVSRDRYDINAKVAPQDLKAWTNQDMAEPTVMRAMLLSMLVDRCHLQLHTIPAEIPGFALAVSRHGVSLQAATPGETVPDGIKLSDGGVATGENLDDGSTTWHFHDASIASLTNFLSMTARTRILDQTGLSGRYNFDLAMSPDRNPVSHGEIKDPGTFWDLRALGLRSVPTKIPTITLVIDHIDPPSDN
jgi:uncharacterized protein (TIGR03435 family)